MVLHRGMRVCCLLFAVGSLWACSVADPSRLESDFSEGGGGRTAETGGTGTGGQQGTGGELTGGMGAISGGGEPATGGDGAGGQTASGGTEGELCEELACQWTAVDSEGCRVAAPPGESLRPGPDALDGGAQADIEPVYLGLSQLWLGETRPAGATEFTATQPWQAFGFDLDDTCTVSATCVASSADEGSCRRGGTPVPVDGNYCIDNALARLQPVIAGVPDFGAVFGITENAINCSLHRGSYNHIVKISNYNGTASDDQVRLDFYASPGLESRSELTCPQEDFRDQGYPFWIASQPWLIAENDLAIPASDMSGLPDAKVFVDDAFVRDGYLVAHLETGYRIRLPGDRAEFPGFELELERAVYVAKLERNADRTWSITSGMVAGAQPTAALAATFGPLGICPDGDYAAIHAAIAVYVQEGADLLVDGAHDPDRVCDAISAGLMFTAESVTVGQPYSTRPQLDCCDPANLGTESCPRSCGDGRVTGQEACDVGIAQGEPGACPVGCASEDACISMTLTGEGCAAHCEQTQITAPSDGDGCCPESAHSENDDDCEPMCGNSVVEAGESCDPADECPKPETCVSSDACISAVITGSADDCNALCTLSDVTVCADDDECCAPGCSFAQDNDCPNPDACGNGAIDDGEFCDGQCPETCPDIDGNSCTAERLVGSLEQCTARCTVSQVTECVSGDGCCPAPCNANNDDDCDAVCGNSIQEPAEECDDGNDASLDGCVECKIETEQSQCLVVSEGDNSSSGCRACLCRRCAGEVLGCSNDADGIANEQCEAVVTCGRINLCDIQACYCGWNPWCLVPIGPCQREMNAAAGSAQPLVVLGRLDDLNYPLGRAEALASCRSARCVSECGF